MPQQIKAPTKEQVRAWAAERAKSHTPPPSLEEIRRQLRWFLIPDRSR